ncbi:hypothetical protein Tsubulata_011777 [Turnera subulata]|uniref:Gamma-glutamylcyclotransferase family protein n=1 Tax=Turnera subulata TaxID=218843 RepID=A0A9Q0GDT9_9ROSI|nr:hypothetical protein Tsubulata_011777 [Turnera subulata]
MADANATKQTLIFTYGTLKQNFPNYHLMQDLIAQDDASYLGSYVTNNAYPLVIGPHGIPYLINLPGQGNRVRGDLYSVSSTRGLARVDELEGTGIGHYERLHIQVVQQGEGDDGTVLVDVEAYFANRSFGERMWVKKGRVGLSEFGVEDGKGYVKKVDRPSGGGYLDDIELFLADS